jgi:adenylate kinase family enzyme
VARISIVGNSGSGKTRLARKVAKRLGVPHLELDAVFHQPGWTELDLPTFQQRVREFAAQDNWVIDGNYRSRLGTEVWDRADTVVWLDYPRRIVMPRVLRRTFGRVVIRKKLWNGNRESLRNALSWDPETSIIRWAWTQHRPYREGFSESLSELAGRNVEVVRIRRPVQADMWLRAATKQARATAARRG